jgi:hypothetical protein
MSKVVYEKNFYGNGIEEIDPMDFLENDDIQVDSYGDAHGTFTVTVTYTPDPLFDQDE